MPEIIIIEPITSIALAGTLGGVAAGLAEHPIGVAAGLAEHPIGVAPGLAEHPIGVAGGLRGSTKGASA